MEGAKNGKQKRLTKAAIFLAQNRHFEEGWEDRVSEYEAFEDQDTITAFTACITNLDKFN